MAFVSDQKFSTFQAGGNPTTGDIIVGLRDGINTKFNWVLPQSVNSITGSDNQVLVNGSSGVPVTGAISLTLPQDIAPTSSPTFAGFNDSDGNIILQLAGVTSGVNYVSLNNQVSGQPPGLVSHGLDADVPLGFLTQGAGLFDFRTTANSALSISSGTGYQHGTFFEFADTSNINTVTFQDSSGTLAYLSDIPSVSAYALTEIDDTNVTMVLGGTPSTALLQPVSMTLGWTGQLSLTRGGSNANLTASNGGIVYSTASAMAILNGTSTNNLPLLSGTSAAPTWGAFPLLLGGALITTGAHTLFGSFSSMFVFTGTTNVTFPTTGTLATTSQLPSASSLTATPDTNVTITLGGTPATALLQPASITLGWTGQLSVPRGGTGLASTTAYAVLCGGTTSTGSLQSVASVGTSGQVLTSNGAGALPTFQTISGSGTVNSGLINQLGWYASNGTAISGLSTAASGVLVTSASSVPSISTTLPNINIGTPTAGVLTNTTGGGGLRSFQIFTSGSGATYTKPANVTSILVEVIGGGGGGGGASGAAASVGAAGGGGAGGYASLFVASAASTYTYTVGAGGAGGTAGANNGSTGGTSSFSASSLQATGGVGGNGATAIAAAVGANSALGGAGGIGSNGNFNAAGAPGATGIMVVVGSGSSSASGAGGSSVLGGGGLPVMTAAGNVGRNYGSGGSGASTLGTSLAGGTGSAGLIVVWEFS